jgi:hypothetical protein
VRELRKGKERGRIGYGGRGGSVRSQHIGSLNGGSTIINMCPTEFR